MNKNVTGIGTGVHVARTDADLRPRGDRAPGATYGVFAADITPIGFAASN